MSFATPGLPPHLLRLHTRQFKVLVVTDLSDS